MATSDSINYAQLVKDAKKLIKELKNKLGKKEGCRNLQGKAKAIIDQLDEKFPYSSDVEQTFGVLRNFAYYSPNDHELLQQVEKAQEIQHTAEKSVLAQARYSATSNRLVDAWTLDILRATESAIPREKLIKDFVERYREVHQIPEKKDIGRHRGPWLFVFETTELEHTESEQLVPLYQAGIHNEHWKISCAEHLDNWQSDLFLRHVFRDGYDIDGWYALPMGGSLLFDALVGIKRHFKGEPNYWINAVSLPGDRRYPTRGVFILYPNTGGPSRPEPPQGQRQDQRLLAILGLTWRQLEHQIKTLASLSEADRREIINLIAPGLMHHEIGFSMRAAYGQAFDLFQLLKSIYKTATSRDMEWALRYAHGVAGQILKLYQITDVFNNLDKRAKVEESDLHAIFCDLKLLLNHRLGASGTEFKWDETLFTQQKLRTDIVLFTQALINIINNAINALEDHHCPSPRRIFALLMEKDVQENLLSLTILNTGPPIEQKNAENIFKRGFTTRQGGHGQGLYLARLVSHYLGGNLELLNNEEFPKAEPPYQVGFKFTLSRVLSAEEGVAREEILERSNRP